MNTRTSSKKSWANSREFKPRYTSTRMPDCNSRRRGQCRLPSERKSRWTSQVFRLGCADSSCYERRRKSQDLWGLQGNDKPCSKTGNVPHPQDRGVVFLSRWWQDLLEVRPLSCLPTDPAGRTTLSPLYRLLRQTTAWHWGSKQKKAFWTVKNLQKSSQVE